MFSELPGSVVWHLSLVLENPQPRLLQISWLLHFLFFFSSGIPITYMSYLLQSSHNFWIFRSVFLSLSFFSLYFIGRFPVTYLHSHWFFPHLRISLTTNGLDPIYWWAHEALFIAVPLFFISSISFSLLIRVSTALLTSPIIFSYHLFFPLESQIYQS